MQTVEYDIATQEEINTKVNSSAFTWKTLTGLDSHLTLKYNDYFVVLSVTQQSNAGSSAIPQTFNYTIPSNYAPSFAMLVDTYTAKSGVPYGVFRINTSGSCNLIITTATYTSSGGTSITATITYPRK